MSHYNIKGLTVKKSCKDRTLLTNRTCKSCQAIFQSSLLDDEVYCENCKDDEGGNKDYSYGNPFDDIVNTSCRTSPVFYD